MPGTPAALILFVSIALPLVPAADLAVGPEPRELRVPQSVLSRFPPMPGFEVLNRDEQGAARAEFRLGPLETVEVTGRLGAIEYDFPSESGAPLPLDTARYYRAQLERQGGVVIYGVAGLARDDGASFTGVIARERPFWLSVEVGNSGTFVKIVAVEDEAASRAEVPIAPDRIAGRWQPPKSLAAGAPADRGGVQSFVSRVGAWLRARATIAAPAGGHLWIEGGIAEHDPADSGPLPFNVSLIWRNLFQKCASCDVFPAGEYGSVLDFRVNDFSADQSIYADEDGRPFYEPEAGPSIAPGVWRVEGGFVIERAGRPSRWLPVARERYLRAKLRWHQSQADAAIADLSRGRAEALDALKTLERMNPAAAAEARKALADAAGSAASPAFGVQTVEAELAALSEAERAQPATDNGRRIVTLNPAYFDRALPRTAPQLVHVRFAEHNHSLHRADVLDALRAAMTPAVLSELTR